MGTFNNPGHAHGQPGHGPHPAPFHGFTNRDGFFDWRLLHGIDADVVMRLTEVRAIEECLDTLQRGALGDARGLSAKNCSQLFRLLQLAVEYLMHLRTANARLLARYDEAVAAADGWRTCAVTYLEHGEAFVSECATVGAMSRQRLETVDAARSELQVADQLYNVALDRLETEDVYAHQFHFRRQRGELLWQQVHSVDLDEVMANVDTAALEKVLPNLVFGSIVTEDREELTPHHFSQLIPLSQCCLDYVLSQANTTGIMLEASMARLQAAVTDIPALTPATHALHEAITSIVLEAHHSQQQQRPYSSHFASSTAPAGAFGGGGGGRGGGGSRGGGVGHRAWASANVAEVGMPPELFAATTASLLPALEVQSRTAELHYKVVSLESDLKMERHKTDEMRRILADIRDRFNVNAPPAGGSGGGGAPTPWLQRPPGYDAGAAASIGASPFEYAAGAAGAAALGWFNGASHGTQTAGGSTVGGGTPGTSPTRFRVTVDESAIRGDERRRAMELIHMQVESLKAQVLSSRPAAGNERGRPVRSPRRTTRDASPRRERADSGERQGSQRLVRVNSTRDDGGGGGAPPSRLARHSPSLSVPIMPDVSISDALLLSPILPANAAVPSLGGSGGIPRTDSWAPSNAREAADFMRAAAAAAKPPRPPRPMSPRSTSSRVPGHTRAASEVPASVAAGGVVGEL